MNNKDKFEMMKSLYKEAQKLYKENKLSAKEISDMFKEMSLMFYQSHLKETNTEYNEKDRLENHPKITQETKDALCAMQENMMQQVIDFVNEHKDVQEAIANTKKLFDNWSFEPDVRFNFSTDGLDASIDAKKWLPYTDSWIGLTVAHENIIYNM